MVDPYYSVSSHSHSQPSSPPGNKVKEANEDEKFEETEFFEDTLVINSPFTENLNMNTELVEDSDPTENTTSEYEQEVVLDSEDEEMENSEAVTVAKGLVEDETSPTLKNPLMRFREIQLKSPCEQAISNATTWGNSAMGDKGVLTDAERFYDNDRLYLPARLNHIHSAVSRDSTEAALGFVDRFLSSSNVDFFQEIQYRKATTVKSPHVPSARGPLSLAKKIKTRTQKEEKEPFKLVDSDQNDKGAGIFCKNIGASSNFGNYRQTYMRKRQKKGGHLQNQGNNDAGNRCEEKLVQGPGMVTENNNSIKELDVRSSATRENVNGHSSVECKEDMPDIGLDTQIAAEAMEALAFVPLPGSHLNDAYQSENALDGSLSGSAENESRLKSSSCRQNPGLQSITTKSKKRNVSSCSLSTVTSSSACKQTDNQEPTPVSGKMKIILESKTTTERQLENSTCSPISCEHVSLKQVCSRREYISFQPAAEDPKYRNHRSRQTRIKGQTSHYTGKNISVQEEESIGHKRKGNGLVDNPLKSDAKTKCLELHTNSCRVTGKRRLNHKVQVTPQLSGSTSLLRTDSWVYPKRPRGKRKRANVQINLDAPTILCIDGKESRVRPTRSLEGQDDVDESCFPHSRPLCKASSIDNGRCLLQGNSVQPGSAGDAMNFENLHDMHPLLLAHVEISSNKSVTQSCSEIPATVAPCEGLKISNANHIYNKHHKKPCDKNLPKCSLLKELIRLGVSEPTQDPIWKDMRQRRDMTYVRVLFSKHLDDSVIKQQKKILARFNISTASSSMEATHFVADKFTRTKNMLEIMAHGKLVVTHLWLESCGQASCFIDEKNYILRDVKKEKEIGFNMPVSLAQARQKPLLKGKRVYLTPYIKPDKEVVASLVTAVHGQVVDESQICADKDDNILDNLLILSCEDDYAICHHFLKRGIPVYSSELLLNGIVIQKLELKSHQLFMNQVKRSNPSTSNRFGKVYKRRLRPVSGP